LHVADQRVVLDQPGHSSSSPGAVPKVVPDVSYRLCQNRIW
jgi:hypothetical protein